jgi:hypothetical protein
MFINRIVSLYLFSEELRNTSFLRRELKPPFPIFGVIFSLFIYIATVTSHYNRNPQEIMVKMMILRT